MTQQEVDLVFSITATMHNSKWFKAKKRTLEEVQTWVAKQLKDNDISTIPIGASWGVLIKEKGNI